MVRETGRDVTGIAAIVFVLCFFAWILDTSTRRQAVVKCAAEAQGRSERCQEAWETEN